MAWREIDTNGETWHVHAAAERGADAKLWRLMLSFRATNSAGERTAFWHQFPIESDSKSSLFKEADRLSDETLKEVLVQYIS